MLRKFVHGAIVAIVVAAALALPARAGDVTMYALVAANATEPFDDLIKTFSTKHAGVSIKPNYTGTQILEQQLENGAPCDVFVSADLPHVEKIRSEGLIEPFHLLSRLHEVIVVPKANAAHIRSLRDLTNKNVKLIIGVPDVPIGVYTRTIFARANKVYGAGFDRKALANVVSFEVNVKQVLQKIVLNEADAGIVYQTDVDPAAAKAVTVIQIPANLNVPAKNYIAVATHAPNLALARDFVRDALAPAGQAVFYRYGYDR